ncbi:MAG: hypothetical protein A3H28_04445 [Acidobacteria bacterium RIFCSPLOWO2_02_FULL_61_28]|nr:MAG: hypothetical protein A3H28_04445 [Acidobacteria bacterium RIFCSPLOWO2_02_FULL_61_28]
MRSALLVSFAWLIGYRYSDKLTPHLQLPGIYEKSLSAKDIQAKARASASTAGVFLGFSIAVLAVVLGSKEYWQSLLNAPLVWPASTIPVIVVMILFCVVRQERVLSGRGNKCCHYLILILLLFLWTIASLIGPAISRYESTVLGPFVSPMVLQPAFSLSGFALIILSALFQVFSIEFYDSASGWRGGQEEEGVVLRFHLAGLASHSFLFGVCFALLGVSLLLCQIQFWIGSVATLAVLLSVVAMTEIERELWVRRKQPS